MSKGCDTLREAFGGKRGYRLADEFLGSLGVHVFENRVGGEALDQGVSLSVINLSICGGNQYHHFRVKTLRRLAKGLCERVTFFYRIDDPCNLVLGNAQPCL